MKTFKTPFGALYASADDSGITVLSFTKPRLNGSQQSTKAKQHLRNLEAALKDYSLGRSEKLSKVPVNPQGTDFQLKVWNALRKVPAGKTKSYSEIAKQIGKPKAARAVGTACGKNPVCMLVPCHRIVASNGLGGYSGGLRKKEMLLAHERA